MSVDKMNKSKAGNLKKVLKESGFTSGFYKFMVKIKRKFFYMIMLVIYRKGISTRAKKRWDESDPDKHLTWGQEISGDHFIRKVSSYQVFSKNKAVLEIGPGYGRLIKSCLKNKIPFSEFTGIDISKKNVTYLNQNYSNSNIQFIQGDIESVGLSNKYDIVISSLTLKHIFPTFEKALNNIIGYLNKDARLFFDLIEGDQAYFESSVTYIRYYTKNEVQDILRNLSLQLVAFDYVVHKEDYTRLLVIAKKLD